MNARNIPPSELIINPDGSVFHLHLKPEMLADRVVLCGDPDRVGAIAQRFDKIECEVSNREFRTITGTFRGKRITVQSHGIGCDNIEIVLSELDALANIDFETRTIKPQHTTLSLVRIGTSGGLQPHTPIGTYVAAEKCIGFESMLYFYQNSEKVRDLDFEREIKKQLNWQIDEVPPYVVSADEALLTQITHDSNIVCGTTIACNGFYAPQGRMLRLALRDAELNTKIKNFAYNGHCITNFEMESSALSALARLLGHRALTVCCIIAGRQNLQMNTDYRSSLEGLIDHVLERI